MQIRRHKTSDHSQLAELRWLLKTNDGETEAGQDKAAFVRDYCKQLRASDTLGDTVHFVLHDDQHLLGALTIRLVRKELSPNDEEGHWGYLTNALVRKGWRRQGLGSDLLHAAINWARQNGLELLIVWPSERSYPFYKRAGFRGETDPLELLLETSPD